MGAGRARIDRGGKAACRDHDDRRAGPAGDPRKGGAEGGSKAAEQKPGEQKPGAKPDAQKADPNKPKPDAQKADAAKSAQKPQDAEDEQPAVAAAEPARPAARTGGLHEYHTEKWEELYAKRIDETIAALKSANIPVLWVGLPSIRGQKSTADALYLNEFYRARAEAAGILYVDVWDGFVDEQGRYSNRGPDFEGQMRVLRAGDGVHFTKFGARKLAHYAERELRRVLGATPVALTTPEPVQPVAPAQQPAKAAAPAQRPLAGPVFMLTTNADESDELLGGGPARQPAVDPVATSVLVKGEAIAVAAGRADDYSWPPRMPKSEIHRAAAAEFLAGVHGETGAAAPGRPDRAGDGAGPGARRPAAAGSAPAAGMARPSAGLLRPAARLLRVVQVNPDGQRGSVDDPIRKVSIALAHWRPSRIAHTTSDCPRRMSPAANTFGTEVL
jgi:hypothetical protein